MTQGISWLVEKLSAAKEGFCSTKLVSPSQSTFLLFNSLFSRRGREMFYLMMLSVGMIL
jgi:hypothetical protein